MGLASLSAVSIVAWYARRLWLARRGRQRFHEAPLRTMIAAGATGDSSVRLWGRSESEGPHSFSIACVDPEAHLGDYTFMIQRSAADGTFSVEYPNDFPGAPPLAPGRSYSCSIRAGGAELVGRCCFETTPKSASETPEIFSIAAMSCNQPFDDYGAVSESAQRLLAALPDALASYRVKRVLLMGDQVYGDLPERCSLRNWRYLQRVAPNSEAELTECSRDEVRALYQARYRCFWKMSGFQRIQSEFACHPILDDHEIIDNFGSSPDHAGPRYRALFDGALDAFYDYQGQRVLPASGDRRPAAFYHDFEYGTVGGFIMDLRSERRATDDEIRVYSDEQLDALSAFLARNSDKHVILLVLSVPILHVPDWLAQVGSAFSSSDGDLEDRWSNPKAMRDRDRLLRAIRTHQSKHTRQRMVLLGGDVHVGLAGRFTWGEGVPDCYQLVSSAVSNASEFDIRRIVEKLPDVSPVVGEGDWCFEARLLDSCAEAKDASNPYGKLNCGVVEVERISADESTVRLLLLGSSDDDPPRVRVVFDSGRL